VLLLIAVLGIAGVLAGSTLLDVHGLAFTLLLALFFTTTGAQLLEVGKRQHATAHETSTLDVMKKLLELSGYSLTVAPRTGNPEVDPMIVSVDLLALAGSKGYAIKLHVLQSQRSKADWSLAVDIRAGAIALQRALGTETAATIQLQPYVLVVGGRVSDDLRAFSEKEGIVVAQVPNLEHLQEAADSGERDATVLKAALRSLQVVPGDPHEVGGGSAAGASA
jgi:hypothetical protein